MWDLVRPWLFPVWCIACGAADVAFCERCAPCSEPIEHVGGTVRTIAAAAYEGHLRSAILAMKRGERAYLTPLATMLAPLIARSAVLVPLVTGRRRAAERGFDQSRELAWRAAAISGARVVELLRKRGRPQRGRSRLERTRAVGRFRIRAGVSLPPSVVLVDDVLTTGATIADAAATLTRAGVRVDGAVVVAYAPLRETLALDGESDRA